MSAIRHQDDTNKSKHELFSCLQDGLFYPEEETNINTMPRNVVRNMKNCDSSMNNHTPVQSKNNNIHIKPVTPITPENEIHTTSDPKYVSSVSEFMQWIQNADECAQTPDAATQVISIMIIMSMTDTKLIIHRRNK